MDEDQKKLLKYKEDFANNLQDRACKMDWKHDYYFSHYETNNDNPHSTAAYLTKYAIMICRHCGHYVWQKV